MKTYLIFYGKLYERKILILNNSNLYGIIKK